MRVLIKFFPCPMPHAPCPMPHAQCPMPNAPCPIPKLIFRTGAYTVISWFSTSSSCSAFSLKRQLP
ncbi:hypothetical protein H6G81_27965 [Scytonema hofmannii FACHB-248]|uniref:Uncharacterized protein n=1 Tax=Scytonema hofmannii FACHB-248 TaxID=1842502 RepID=A0ABR8GXI0_9CYAN|nr:MULTISPECIES: hypothetical protein [Nostocales]MBD2608246.1 hypothetical protein [Scytonema hofmannii FACHB-248]